MNSETPLLLRRFPGTREGTASPQGHRRAASHLPPPHTQVPSPGPPSQGEAEPAREASRQSGCSRNHNVSEKGNKNQMNF